MQKVFAALLRRLPQPVRSRVPARFRARTIYRQIGPRHDTTARVTFSIDSDLEVHAYWLRISNEEGPSASVFWRDTEIMRIDMLSANPHVHYRFYGSMGQVGQSRIQVPPAPAAALTDRLEHELATNVVFALHLDPRPEVNQHHIDPVRMAEVAAAVAHHLRSEVETRAQQ